MVDSVLTNISKLRETLNRDYQVKDFQLKYTKYSTLIFTSSYTDYQNTLSYMKSQAELDNREDRSHFHTYTPASSKTHGFVLRGLDHQPSEEEVREALFEEHEIETYIK